MNARQLPSGNWRARAILTDPETKKRTFMSFTAATKKEAELLALQYENSHKMNPTPINMTVDEAISAYIANRTKICSPTTIRRYLQFQKDAYGSISHISISKLTSNILQGWINSYSATHAPKTVKSAWGLLISSITVCDSSFKPAVTLPAKEVITYSLPTQEQFKEMLENANPELKKAILLAGILGMRRGEIAALTYEDIKGDTIHIHSDMIRTSDNQWVIKKIPKTSASDRYVDAPHEVIELLGDGEGRVVNMVPNSITKAFVKLRDKMGLSCRFHDLRHFAASLLHAIAIPDVYIMESMGWKSDHILKNVYRNSLSDEKKRFTEKANSYLTENLLKSSETND